VEHPVLLLGLGFVAVGAAILLAWRLWHAAARGRVSAERAWPLGAGLGVVATAAIAGPIAMFRGAAAASPALGWMIVLTACGAAGTLVLLVEAVTGARARRWKRVGLALVPVIAAPLACQGVQVLARPYHGDRDYARMVYMMTAGSLTIGLLAGALVGDRSRGRRRCPKCWYNMSATSSSPHTGLVCPECGHDARRDVRLFKSRRRKRYIAASFVPLLAGGIVYGFWLADNGRWLKTMPTPVLIAATPWLSGDLRMGGELAERIDRSRVKFLPAWQRRLLGVVARREMDPAGDPNHVLYLARMLIITREHDDATAATVREMLTSPNLSTVTRTIGVLDELVVEDPGWSAAVEDDFTKVANCPDARLRDFVNRSLLKIKSEHPGGTAPAQLLLDALDDSKPGRVARDCSLLACYDSSEATRATLRAAVQMPEIDRFAKTSALIALTRHAPDDDRTRELLIEALGNPEWAQWRHYLIKRIFQADRWFLDERGALLPARRALYSDGVRGAIVEAVRFEPYGPDGAGEDLREMFAAHPCFQAP
jgi:hypothetical protein